MRLSGLVAWKAGRLVAFETMKNPNRSNHLLQEIKMPFILNVEQVV
jgi:hypothetical protein